MSSQLLTVGQVASLIGDCEFIREAEGVLTIHAEAFVNGILLQRLLEQYGELCSFQSLDPNGLLYKCEFYDARHAHSAMSDINASTSYPLGVPLKTTLDRSASSQNTMSLPPALLNLVSHHQQLHHSSPAPPDHAAYMFPPTPTTPHYPQLGGSGGRGTSMGEDEDEVERLLEENGKHPSSTSFASASTLTARHRRGLDPLRGRHDTIHLPAGPPRLTAHSSAYLPASSQSPASNDKHGHPNTATRSRRSSTGTSVVPGEDTPFALEKFRASLAVVSGAGASSHHNSQSNGNVNGSNGPGSLGLGLSSSSSGSSVEDTSVVDGLGLGLKIKETGAGLMLVDDLDGMGPPSSAGRMDLSDHTQGNGGSESPFRRGRTTFRAQQITTASHRSAFTTAAQPRRRPSKIALPPFMGPLPLPSPLPLPTFWSASSGVPGGEEGGLAAGRRGSAIPFPFGKGNEVSSGGQVLYNSEGALDGSSPNTMPGTKATGPPLRPFNAHIGPRLRTSRLQGQRSSPNSPTTPTTPSDNTITNGGTIPPLYAAANRPLLPLSARTALSQTRDPPSPRNTVDLDKIASGMDTRTTIMIKNVPSRMTLSDMEAFINKVCEREYDFLYLRMDFVTGNNVGYAFVNFIEVSSLLKFLQTYLGKRWNLYSSDKVMYAAYATYQGKAALVTKFQNSSILDREDQVKPHIYHSSGEDKGLPEPFPPPNDSARKARSMAAASEHGLFSRMEYNRRQQLSQNPSPSSSSQPLSPTAPKLFASSPLAARSQMSPNKLRPITIPQSVDGSDYYFDAPLNSRSSSSYASPQGLASPQQHTPTSGRTKPNPSFSAGRSSARRGSEGPQTAMFGRRASATLIPSP
ncbi:hypothetical protein FRC04_002051 [Tulasnella sp. 424]|nr:hypothetical protein FRC04_002051 [Tulasnella sp. 424]